MYQTINKCIRGAIFISLSFVLGCANDKNIFNASESVQNGNGKDQVKSYIVVLKNSKVKHSKIKSSASDSHKTQPGLDRNSQEESQELTVSNHFNNQFATQNGANNLFSAKPNFSEVRTIKSLTQQIAATYKLTLPKKVFVHSLPAAVYDLTEEQLKGVQNDPNVLFVEEDKIIRLNPIRNHNDNSQQANSLQAKAQQATSPSQSSDFMATSFIQDSATWGLDRIDQPTLPLNQTFQHNLPTQIVNAYIIDTGIMTSHQNFQGRALHGRDLVDNDDDATDCNGHGTHVAGTVGSSTYGVAKTVKLHAVRVLDCAGSGSISDVIAGIEWVTLHHVKPAVANMSLGGGASQAIDAAIQASIQAGVTYVVAAGNENMNACNGSPARVPDAITVGSTTKLDGRSSFSNFGSCVDIFAPGSDITSTWIGSSTETDTISGTSMASPHVAGVVALYLAKFPNATPLQVREALVAQATPGRVTSPGTGSPNKLLNLEFLLSADDPSDDPGDDPGPPSPPAPQELQNGVAIANLSGSKNSELHFTLKLPANMTNLKIEIFGGSGDADLYVKKSATPTSAQYDCRPYTPANQENCEFINPQSATWYVVVRGYADFNNVSIRATYNSEGSVNQPCTHCVSLSGVFTGRGQARYVPGSSGAQLKSGVQKYWLRGPSSADFDLYLYKYNGSQWVEVASAVGVSSTESIEYRGASGLYRVRIYSYSGGGAYTFWREVP